MTKFLYFLPLLILVLTSCGDEEPTTEYLYDGIEVLGKHTLVKTDSGFVETDLYLGDYSWEEYHLLALEAPQAGLANIKKIVIDGETVIATGVDEEGNTFMETITKKQWENESIPALYTQQSNGDYTFSVCTYIFVNDMFSAFDLYPCDEVSDMKKAAEDYFNNKNYTIGDTLSMGNFRVRYALQ